jgi:hypothetical protein
MARPEMPPSGRVSVGRTNARLTGRSPAASPASSCWFFAQRESLVRLFALLGVPWLPARAYGLPVASPERGGVGLPSCSRYVGGRVLVGECYDMAESDPQMMFPPEPRFGDKHVSAGADFVWDGLAWSRVEAAPRARPQPKNHPVVRVASGEPGVEGAPDEREIF